MHHDSQDNSEEYSAAKFIEKRGTERDSTIEHCTAATCTQCNRLRGVIKQTKLN